MSGDRGVPEASATLKVRYRDEGAARAVCTAISPDNFQAPAGIEIDAEARGGEFTVSIACPRGVRSLLATLDDLLSCIQTAERTIESVSS